MIIALSVISLSRLSGAGHIPVRSHAAVSSSEAVPRWRRRGACMHRLRAAGDVCCVSIASLLSINSLAGRLVAPAARPASPCDAHSSFVVASKLEQV